MDEHSNRSDEQASQQQSRTPEQRRSMQRDMEEEFSTTYFPRRDRSNTTYYGQHSSRTAVPREKAKVKEEKPAESLITEETGITKVPKRDAPIITIHGIMSDKSMMYKNFLKSNKLKIN